jgi:C1A family cysteine protease
MILGLLLRKPKLMLVLLVVGGLFFLLGGGKGCNMDGGGGGIVSQLLQTNTGATFDPKLYDQAEVYEPLADNVNEPLPERVSLEQFAPKRLNQGVQGSCVAWASAYAARTIVQAQATKADPNSTAFSPSFLYNQIKIDGSDCQGSYIYRAMENMLKGGVLPYSRFAYTDQSCAKLPTEDERRQAMPYRIKGFQRLTRGADEQRTDMVAMKQHLSQGSPVVIGMMVGGSFMQEMEGRELWEPTRNDYRMPGFGGHAMCVIGYDDYKFGNEGGFQIMNSWGPEWGKKGIAWVRYGDFDHFGKEAYAVYPQGEGVDVKPQRFDLRFGLVAVDADGKATGAMIPLKHMGGRVFRTEQPVPKGTRFKVQMTNNAECYTYCFGQETDGSSYVLFPNTPKHSPYCGITGTRVFPKDQSMTVDEVGTRDVMAILVYNQPIDFPKVDAAMKADAAKGLDAKLTAVLGGELIDPANVSYTAAQGAFGASCAMDRNAVAFVIEVDKR